MLWAIRKQMKPALSVIDMIPNVHRTPALALLKTTILDGRPPAAELSRADRDIALFNGPVALISPIGARILRTLYQDKRIKLKKPDILKLPMLDDFVSTEIEFRQTVASILADEEKKLQRISEIIEDPLCAHLEELTPQLIDKVITSKLGHNVCGSFMIAGVLCHKNIVYPVEREISKIRTEGKILCWWTDEKGVCRGDKTSHTVSP